MLKRVLLLTASVALIGTLVGGATLALFTAETLPQNNEFTAGTVDIAIQEQGSEGIEEIEGPIMYVTDMAPGDTEEFFADVRATGSLDTIYQMTFHRTSGGAYLDQGTEEDDALAQALQMRIYRWGESGWEEFGDVHQNGGSPRARTLQEWFDLSVPDFQGFLEAGDRDEFKFVVHLPLATGNAAQGGSVQFRMDVWATQAKNFGLQADFFEGKNFDDFAFSRIDPTVNYDWSHTRPIPGFPQNVFSIRWTGYIVVPEAGNYQFQTTGDDGIRLYVDGTQLINDWTDHGDVNRTSPSISLPAGKVPVTMEWYDNQGKATAKLRWRKGTTGSFNIIPQLNLMQPEP